jgi:hypothetical protein
VSTATLAYQDERISRWLLAQRNPVPNPRLSAP